jgi:hypothetical protein
MMKEAVLDAYGPRAEYVRRDLPGRAPNKKRKSNP